MIIILRMIIPMNLCISTVVHGMCIRGNLPSQKKISGVNAPLINIDARTCPRDLYSLARKYGDNKTLSKDTLIDVRKPELRLHRDEEF